MTPRQSELLGFIRRHVERCGYSPSLKDMAAAIGKSHSRTERVIGQLVDLGHVKRVAHGVYVVSDLPPGDNIRPVGRRRRNSARCWRRSTAWGIAHDGENRS